MKGKKLMKANALYTSIELTKSAIESLSPAILFLFEGNCGTHNINIDSEDDAEILGLCKEFKESLMAVYVKRLAVLNEKFKAL